METEDRTMDIRNGEYLDILLDSIRICANYRPKFGQGSKGGGLTLEQFRSLYRGDAFYGWFGLDNPLMYSAHRAAGGMTSLYRQIGIGCEKLFRRVIQDSLDLSADDVAWSYQVALPGGRKRTLHLDGRVPLEKIRDESKRNRFYRWMSQSAKMLDVDDKVFKSLTGAVFEVRQGYKSKDSKRQNADIANSAAAYASGYFPSAMIFSTQIDGDVLTRYRAEKWSVMTGIAGASDTLTSTYDFMREVIGFDLAAFFQRNSSALRGETDAIVETLISPLSA